MADKLLKDLNKINKLCKRLFDSYIICGDMIIGQNDGKACNNVFCRLNTVLDISIDNRDSVIHIVPDAIVYLFKEYKSKELDIVKQDENGNLICILPDKEIVFAHKYTFPFICSSVFSISSFISYTSLFITFVITLLAISSSALTLGTNIETNIKIIHPIIRIFFLFIFLFLSWYKFNLPKNI